MRLPTRHAISTPANWKQGEDVIVIPSIPTDEAKQRFPKGVTELERHLRLIPDPSV